MSETRHTPGPWSVEDPLGPYILSIVQAGKPTYEWKDIAILTAEADEIPMEVVKANARLIAAAPELLEALKDAAGIFGALQPNRPAGGIQDRIEAVIAKAEGRP